MRLRMSASGGGSMLRSPSRGCECSIEQGFFHWDRRAVGADIAGDSRDEDNRNKNTDGSESRGGDGQTTAHIHHREM